MFSIGGYFRDLAVKSIRRQHCRTVSQPSPDEGHGHTPLNHRGCEGIDEGPSEAFRNVGTVQAQGRQQMGWVGGATSLQRIRKRLAHRVRPRQ